MFNITLSKLESAFLHFAVPPITLGITMFFGAHPDIAQMTVAAAVGGLWNLIQGYLTTAQSA